MVKKILIIEDDQFLRKLIADKLSQEGFQVLEAVNGQEGIKKTKKERPDLVLLGLVLPGLDGFEVLSRIKEDSGTSLIPVIILSHLGQKEDVEKAKKLGATDYLIKAHLPGEIIEKIKLHLE